MKTILTLVAIFVLSLTSFGQEEKINTIYPSDSPLTVGDVIPDFQLQMLNYKDSIAKISDFRGKLLILDFWSTFCTSCIAAFPKMAKLQEKYGDRIMILPVSGFYSAEYNRKFIGRLNSKELKMTLPTAVEADTLFEIFPFNGLPHEVWISPSGRVIGITGQTAVNEGVIDKVLADSLLTIPGRIFSRNDFSKPMLVNNNGAPDSCFSYRSIITKYIPSLTIMSTRIKTSSGVRIAEGNSTPVGLLLRNLGNAKMVPDTLLDLKRVMVRNRLYADKPFYRVLTDPWEDDKFKRENLFNIELSLPTGFSYEEAFRFCAQDIERFFRLKHSIKMEDVDVLLLKDLSKGNHKEKAATSQGNENLNALVERLNFYLPGLPVIINESAFAFTEKIDFAIERDMPISKVNARLNELGLVLVPGRRKLSFLVIE